jgi:hypothetical protein
MDLRFAAVKRKTAFVTVSAQSVWSITKTTSVILHTANAIRIKPAKKKTKAGRNRI